MGVAGAIAATGVLSAGASLIGGSQASGAAKNAAGLQMQQYQTTRGDLLPYNQAGQSVLPSLTSLATSGPNAGGPDYVTQAAGARPPSVFTQANLEATPGYQFTLGQGLKSVQNAAAARGVGVSGAALKGAATFATGLADSTYSNRFNEAQQSFNDILALNQAQQGNVQNAYNRLSGVATLGANAAAQTGQQGTAAAGNAGNALQQAGVYQGAATSGIGSAASNAVNNYLGYQAFQGLTNRGNTGGYQFGQNLPSDTWR